VLSEEDVMKEKSKAVALKSEVQGAQNQKPTPGPWAVSAVNKYIVHPIANPRFGICITNDEDEPTAEDEANAHLIAAAPELLEQLIHARAFVPANQPTLRASINAAIAKAEGRQ